MNFLRAAVKEILGLFVSDYLQVAIVLVILALVWFAVSKLHTVALLVLVVLLAAQLVWFARAEARRRRRTAPKMAGAEPASTATKP